MAFGNLDRLKGEIPDGSFTSLIDDKSRFEIDDSNLKFNFDNWTKKPNGYSFNGKLGDAITHTELFKHYPELKDLKCDLDMDPANKFGGFNTSYIKVTAQDEFQLKQALVHEIQHAIQGIEGFSLGFSFKDVTEEMMNDTDRKIYRLNRKLIDSPDEDKDEIKNTIIHLLYDNYKKDIKLILKLIGDEAHRNDLYKYLVYYRISGEAEAREAATRMDYSADQRLNKSPELYRNLKDVIPNKNNELSKYLRRKVDFLKNQVPFKAIEMTAKMILSDSNLDTLKSGKDVFMACKGNFMRFVMTSRTGVISLQKPKRIFKASDNKSFFISADYVTIATTLEVNFENIFDEGITFRDENAKIQKITPSTEIYQLFPTLPHKDI